MRRTQVNIDDRADGRWDVSVGLWQIHAALGVGDRDYETAARADLDAAGVIAYLRELIGGGYISRETHVMISDIHATSSGGNIYVADIIAGRVVLATAGQ